MQIVAGLTLKHLTPRVWDIESPHHLPQLSAVMISYADFIASPSWRRRAMRDGLREALSIPRHLRIFLDNGAFAIARRGGSFDEGDYAEFTAAARPDWFPIPRDEIPAPQMTPAQKSTCFRNTMRVNRRSNVQPHATDDCGSHAFVPVVHVGEMLPNYLRAIKRDPILRAAPALGVGGIVPNLLRAPKARPYAEVLNSLRLVRRTFPEKKLHIFGVGGTATVHLCTLLGFDSADSSGWRNRAAHGIVQLPGSGDRMVEQYGNWRGRGPNDDEWQRLRDCPCPACLADGETGLRANKTAGFAHRATHNLWVLLEEARWVARHLNDGSYADHFRARLDNPIYLPLIEQALQIRQREEHRIRRAPKA